MNATQASFLVLSTVAAAACSSPVTGPCGGGKADADSWVLSSGAMTLVVEGKPYVLSILDADGRVVLQTSTGEGDGYAAVANATGEVDYDPVITQGYYDFAAFLDPWTDRYVVARAEEGDGVLTVGLAAGERCVEVVHRIDGSRLRVEATAASDTRAWATAFATDPDEAFLGLGERFNRTNQRGLDVFSWSEEGGIGTGEGTVEGPDNPFPSGESMTYYPVPFFLSTKGYGFWLDTTYRSEFNLATERPDAWRAWHVGSELAFEVYLPLEDDERPWPYHIIDQFTATTGRPMLPPAWTYGPRRRVNYDDQQGEVSEIQAMRDLDLAVTAVDDAMHFYPSAKHLGLETVLASWIGSAEQLGYRVNGYFNSFVDRRDDAKIGRWAAEGVSEGHFLRTGDGEYPDIWIITGGDTPPLYLVDFTNPRATQWYQSSFDWATALGYSGWMYDFGEYVPPEVVAADGRSGEALHNDYPVLYAKAVNEAMETGERRGDWLAFMRSGYTGSSAFVPMVWSGDPAASFEESDGLPSMIPAGLNLGISGAPNSGGDIGGFHCTADGDEVADAELLVRWIQQGSMMPNMQEQDACVGGGTKASIWTEPAAMDAWRRYARLHTRLFPYFYTLGQQASASGAPIMRQFFLEHPDRPELADIDDAYYLGSALVVAPVVERGQTSKTVRLPPGRFLEWNSLDVYDGDREVVLPAPVDTLPLLLREGHLLPLLDSSIDTLAEESNTDVIGLSDVADVYDIVGFVGSGRSSLALYDGSDYAVTVSGEVQAPALAEAETVDELAGCTGCYMLETLATGIRRLRVSTGQALVTAGGVVLEQSSARRVRWDLFFF